jgi:hypothetical protein
VTIATGIEILPRLSGVKTGRQALPAYVGICRRRFAQRVRRGCATEPLEPRRLGDASGDRDDGIAAERMAGGADMRRINPAAEGLVVSTAPMTALRSTARSHQSKKPSTV